MMRPPEAARRRSNGVLFTASSAEKGREAKARNVRSRIDRFAEALSEIGSVNKAGASIGLPRSTASDYFTRIKRDLGWQAS